MGVRVGEVEVGVGEVEVGVGELLGRMVVL